MGKKDWIFGGSILGWAIGGPIGGIIGGLLGTLFPDDDRRITLKCPHCKKEVEIEPSRGTIWECSNCGRTFVYDPLVAGKKPVTNVIGYKAALRYFVHAVFCGFIANLDGGIDKREKARYSKILDSIELGKNLKKALIKIFDSDVTRNEDPMPYWDKFLKERLIVALSGEPEEAIIDFLSFFFGTGYDIAIVNPPVSIYQEHFIKDVAESLDISEKILENIKRLIFEHSAFDDETSSQAHYMYDQMEDMKRAYEILEIMNDADCSVIKKAYRNKMKKLHPDRHKDLPPEVYKILQEKIQEINNAYDILKKYKGC